MRRISDDLRVQYTLTLLHFAFIYEGNSTLLKGVCTVKNLVLEYQIIWGDTWLFKEVKTP